MVIIKQSYRNNGKFKKILEKDSNDQYYNVLTEIKKNDKWVNKGYYKYKSKAEANKVYMRV
jgi:hypothetical protein